MQRENKPVLKGVSVAVLSALDATGSFDPASQERLLSWVLQDGEGAHVVFSGGTTGEWNRLDPAELRRVNEACATMLQTQNGPGLWAGVTARRMSDLLENIEHAFKIGVEAAVLAPLAVIDAPPPVELFQKHILPLMEQHGRALPFILYDNADLSVGHRDTHIPTKDVKQLSRLDIIKGIKVSQGAKVVGNYLKAARHFNDRHEFGVYLGDADALFSIFTPAQDALDNVRAHWNRLWLGAEMPHGAATGSANLFPRVWRKAWQACLEGDAYKVGKYKQFFKEVSLAWGFMDGGRQVSKAVACMKLALVEEKVLRFATLAPGSPGLTAAQAKRWLKSYAQLRRDGVALAGPLKKQPGPGAAVKKVSSKAESVTLDVMGLGGVVADEIRLCPEILGPDRKGLSLPAKMYPGGVMLNQLSWVSALGLRAGVLGWAGDDSDAGFLRAAFDRNGVNHDNFVEKKGSTSIARIFVDLKGEREIYLESGVSETITPAGVRALALALSAAPMLMAEISLIPLASQLEAFKIAHKAGAAIFLDLDIPPSQAAGAQGLGSRAEVNKLLLQADYLKCSMSCARELVKGSDPLALAKSLHRKLVKKNGCWVTVTNGELGMALYNGLEGHRVAAVKAGKVLDTTGAGDAAMAGLVAGTAYQLSLHDTGRLAAAAGAACVAQMGASPDGVGARRRILSHYQGRAFKAHPWPKSTITPRALGAGFFAKGVIEQLNQVVSGIQSKAMEQAIQLITGQMGHGHRLHVTGVGKPEYVAGYTASSMSSTGTPAYFLHATEAAHGAAGQVSKGDVVIAISNSGETGELKAAVATLKRNGAKILGVGGKAGSWLDRQSDVFLFAGVKREGDSLNMAPRASVMAEILVLAALGVELQERKGFNADDFRSFHPGGSLGKTK